METHPRRTDWPVLALGAVIVLVALIAAVSVISGSTAAAQTTSPQLQTEPVQDSQATPAPEEGGQPAAGDREDCPEKDGDGAAQPENQSAAPESGTSTPQV